MYTDAIITVLLYIFIFVFGSIIGSFLNVCIYRIPKKESLLPSSHCMECGHRLRWYDLFPVFSYLLLRGRCRYCGAKVSGQYPVIELLNGILYLVVFMASGFHLQSVLYCLMTSALIVIAVIDERTLEIPLGLNVFLLVLGVLMCVLEHDRLMEHLIGMVCVSAALYLLWLFSGGRAIGGGDVKLMAAAGLLLGWKMITLAFFLGCIIGAVCHVVRMRVSKAEHVLAMGPYLAIAIWLCDMWGRDLVGWYFGIVLR